MTDQDRINTIRLARSPRIGARAFLNLQANSETYEEAFDRVLKRATEMNIENYKLCDPDLAERELEIAHSLGAQFLASGSDDYSELLNQVEDRPPYLWAMGQKHLIHTPTVAMIGSRNPTIEGARITMQLAKLLSYEGVTIVSGLARGIDGAAHEASITGGTIGVVGGGVDVCYPKSNATLQQIMSEDGLVLSEMPFGHQPRSRDFPRRNRIIAGLSHGVVVIEGNMRSGTRLTVSDAERYGREILAIPGHPMSGLAALPNDLIINGIALMVRNLDDILTALPTLRTQTNNDNEPKPEPSTKEIETVSSPSNRKALAEMGRALIEGEAVMRRDGSVAKIR